MVGLFLFCQYIVLFLMIKTPVKSRISMSHHNIPEKNAGAYTSSGNYSNKLITESKLAHGVTHRKKSDIHSPAQKKYLIPEQISRQLSSHILERMQIDSVANKCQFSALHIKQEKTSKQWDIKRYVVYQCREFCGGLGDRMKGIFSLLIHTISIGYEFVIDWDPSFSLYPEILDSSPWKNWTSKEPRLEKYNPSHFILSMDRGYHPHNLCQWLLHPVIRIQTNGNSIPQGRENCDLALPEIREILKNQTSLMSCLTNVSEQSHIHEYCMGCSWWFLFRIGKMLESRLMVEFNRLASWKKNHKLEESLGIGVHIRSGDSHMSSSNGRESNMTQLVTKIQYCIDDYIEVNPGLYHVVVVSDSTSAKELFRRWPSLKIYCIHTNPIHIDKMQYTSPLEKREALLSVFVDLLMISFQDFLLLSSTSGFGHLAHAVGLYSQKNTVLCM